MGSSTLLLSIISAAAIRLILGADVGLDYDTTAMSSTRRDAYGEPLPRTPWALRVRPDILAAWFNQHHYVYLQGNGAFIQPFSFEGAEGGDNPEGNGQIDLGARLQLGRRLMFHPGAYVRLMSSNSFAQSQDEVSATTIGAGQFNTLAYGGFLEFEFPVGHRLRFFIRAAAEAWNLELCPAEDSGEEGSFVCIPPEVAAVQPTLSITGVISALIALTRRDGLALEFNFDEGLFLEDFHQGEEYDRRDQPGLTGRVIYRRYWLPYLMTDLAVGLTAVRPRSDIQIQPGDWVLAGGWDINIIGSASLIMFGRPRWFTMNLTYQRAYQQLQFRNSGAVLDNITLLFSFGPFDGFGIQTALTWSRFPNEIERRASCEEAGGEDCGIEECQPGPGGEGCDETCTYYPTLLRPINTIGLTLDLQYMYDIRNAGVSFGPFFQGYIYAQIAEDIEVNQDGATWPYVDREDCYLPPNFDPVEAVLLLGFRLQYGYGTARPRRGMAGGTSAVSGSRDERRLAIARMDERERRTPGYAYGARPMMADEADEAALFGRNDPLGRMHQGEYEEEMLYSPWEREERQRQREQEREAQEQEEFENWDWFGEEPPPEEGEETAPPEENPEQGTEEGPILFEGD